MSSNRESRSPSPPTKTGLQVRHISPLCQLQDLGRIGYQSFGVTRSGAIDPYLLRVANILLGNPQGQAALEFSLVGAEFVITAASLKASFAGDFPLSVNGHDQPSYSSFYLRKGDVLNVGNASAGIRGYLSIAGGFDATPELGSCSTHLRSGLGGFSGRAFASNQNATATVGDVLPTILNHAINGHGLFSHEYFVGHHLRRSSRQRLRVLKGPQASQFSTSAIQQFYGSSFIISQQSDRMGYRLEGNSINYADGGNMISDPTITGSIQVPASGDPIVLMADCPTTGGYPKIATLCSVDCGQLAQLAPGSEITFEQISIEQSQALLRDQQLFLQRLSMKLDRC